LSVGFSTSRHSRDSAKSVLNLYWVQINFTTWQWLDKITLYTLQDNFTAPIDPTDTTTFSLYGITGFTAQVWNGSTWVNVGSVTN
jgi:hypothetical protein